MELLHYGVQSLRLLRKGKSGGLGGVLRSSSIGRCFSTLERVFFLDRKADNLVFLGRSRMSLIRSRTSRMAVHFPNTAR